MRKLPKNSLLKVFTAVVLTGIWFSSYEEMATGLIVKAEDNRYEHDFYEAYEVINSDETDSLPNQDKDELKTYVDLAPGIIETDANSELPQQEIPKAVALTEHVDASVQSTLLKKLAKKYGRKFIQKELPKKIYGRLPKAVIKKISLKKFSKYWNTFLLGSLANSVSPKIYKFLVNNHVPKWAANAATAVIASVIWYYIN